MTFRAAPAILLTALAAFAGCKPANRPAPAAPPVPVETAVVERRTVPVELRTIGAAEPLATVQLRAKVAGEITSVIFDDGAFVKAGEPLFTIDPRPFEVALRRAEAALAQAQNESSNAQAQADRYTKLSTQGVASREQFAQVVTTAASQKSVLAARQADVDEARLSLEWATVRAPIPGRAGAALLKTGNIVQANTWTLMVINQTQPIYVTFSLPETQLAEVREWLGRGAVEVTAAEPDSGRSLGSGRLDFVDNVVDRQSGMVTMKATFPNENETLWPGQFVDVVVTLTQERDAIVVPATAIMEGPESSQVFVVRDGIATLRKVTVARAAGERTVIAAGLEPGETVIAAGQLRVANGGRVAVAATPTPTPAP